MKNVKTCLKRLKNNLKPLKLTCPGTNLFESFAMDNKKNVRKCLYPRIKNPRAVIR